MRQWLKENFTANARFIFRNFCPKAPNFWAFTIASLAPSVTFRARHDIRSGFCHRTLGVACNIHRYSKNRWAE